MAVVKKLTRIGDSRAVILPKPFLDQLALDDPDAEVEVSLEKDRIIIAPHRYATEAEFHNSATRVFEKRRGLIKRLSKR
jgi:antitoxin component of MazEF toxin-antitoxin module